MPPSVDSQLAFDGSAFLAEFHDYCVPTLDVYEQSIYLYVVRRSRLIGKYEVTIGFKSARKNLAFGIGTAGSPPSENTCYRKIRSLCEKGLLEIVSSDHSGIRIRAYLPNEAGLIPDEIAAGNKKLDLEEMDFFENPELRATLVKRENGKCFYCNCNLDTNNYVIEHVISRPKGDNSYKNLVAACRRCNNRKSSDDASDFLRTLFREHQLSEEEFKTAIGSLELLKNGELKPEVHGVDGSAA